MSTDLVLSVMDALSAGSHHAIADIASGADQGIANAAAALTEKVITSRVDSLKRWVGIKEKEAKEPYSETPNVEVIADVYEASKTTSSDLKIELLSVLAVKAGQNELEYYQKHFIDVIQAMSPNAARCLKLITEYPTDEALKHYQDMASTFSHELETIKNKIWIGNNQVRRIFKNEAEEHDVTPEIAVLGFAELANAELLSGGDRGSNYRLSWKGLNLVRCLQFEKKSQEDIDLSTQKAE